MPHSALTDEPQVAPGRAGDHPGVYQFLLAVFHGPSREEFHASQDDPTYEPVNRLVVRRGLRVVSHVHLLKRTMQFGPLRLPVDQVNWLGTLPEFRSQGLAGQLLQAADGKMLADGAAVGWLRTRIPHYFHRWGWAVCGRHSFSRGRARNFLARFWAEPNLRREPVNIRQWRHVELPALMRIYAQNTAGTCGPLERTETYWRWLISRKAFDHIMVALAGPDKLELNEATVPIVGYAVVRQQRVVELLTDPAYPSAGPQLLARACADAIERDRHDIRLDSPPGDPLHALMAAAGGTFHHHELDEQEVFMVKLLDAAGFLRRSAPVLESRMRAAEPGHAGELGLLAGGQKWQLTASRRGVKIVPDRLGRSYVACNRAEFTRLVLGHADPVEAAAQGRLAASTQLALQTAGILFPRMPMWRPAWDDLAV